MKSKSNKSVIPNPVVVTPKIADLRRAGWKIRVNVLRPYKIVQHARLAELFFSRQQAIDFFSVDAPRLSYNNFLSNNGGRVTVEVRDTNQQEYKGEAICSKTEAFNHKYGVSLALGRALVAAGYEIEGLTKKINE